MDAGCSPSGWETTSTKVRGDRAAGDSLEDFIRGVVQETGKGTSSYISNHGPLWEFTDEPGGGVTFSRAD